MTTRTPKAIKAKEDGIRAAVQGAELTNAVAEMTAVRIRIINMPTAGNEESLLQLMAQSAIWDAIETLRKAEDKLTEHHGIHVVDAGEAISAAPRLTREEVLLSLEQ